MASGRLCLVYCHVSRNGLTEQVKPRLRDILRFDVTVSLQFLTWYHRVMQSSTLFKASIPITCESLENNENFLSNSLSNPSSSPYFPPEGLHEITQDMVPRVQQLFEVQSFASDTDSNSRSECREFPLSLQIFVEVPEDEGFTMIPASNESIQSLKTFTDSAFLKSENCSICMEGFVDEDLEVSSMPCTHVFHHHCIVKWLHTSHTCPICRYSMPKTSIYNLYV